MVRYFFTKHIGSLDALLETKRAYFYDALVVTLWPSSFCHTDSLPVCVCAKGYEQIDALPVTVLPRGGIFLDTLKVDINPLPTAFYDTLSVFVQDTRNWRQHVDTLKVNLIKHRLVCFDSLAVYVQKKRSKYFDALPCMLFQPPGNSCRFQYDLTAGGVKSLIYDYSFLRKKSRNLTAHYDICFIPRQKEVIFPFGAIVRAEFRSVYGCQLSKVLDASYALLRPYENVCAFNYGIGIGKERNEVEVRYGCKEESHCVGKYSLLEGVSRCLKASYALLRPYEKVCAFNYAVGIGKEKKAVICAYGCTFLKQMRFSYEIRRTWQKVCLFCYVSTSQRLNKEGVFKYALSEREFLRKSCHFVYFAEDVGCEIYIKNKHNYGSGHKQLIL